MSLPIPDVPADLRSTTTWAAAALHALVREEAAGRKPPRLTEPGFATWSRFRGRLGPGHLVQMLFEDAAVTFPVPFDEARVLGTRALDTLDHRAMAAWLQAAAQLDAQPGPDYIAAQARLLGISSRLARSDLHQVKAHQKVLELPGTGGQIAHHLVSTQPELTLQDNLTIACGSWQELTLAGIVALDLGAPHADFLSRVEPRDLREMEHPIRQRRYDFVVGLHPDKGGLFRAVDQLDIWFQGAKIVLV